MNKITKFIWYYSNGGSYIEIDNDKTIRVTMTKKEMQEWAEELNVEFEDKNRRV